jgi:integrase
LLNFATAGFGFRGGSLPMTTGPSVVWNRRFSLSDARFSAASRFASNFVFGSVRIFIMRSSKGSRPYSFQYARSRFHDLRRTVASWLLSKGHCLKAVSTRLGHANPTMTLPGVRSTTPNDDAKLAVGLARMMA